MANQNEQTGDKEALIALLLEGNHAGASGDFKKADRTQPLPLSFTQERLWFLEQLDPGSSVYNLHCSLLLTGSLDVTALQNSINDVVARHEVLRTTFSIRDGETIQCIHDTPGTEIPVIDLKDNTAEEQDAAILSLSSKEAATSFDLDTGPLLRLVLIKISDVKHCLLLTVHHIITDAWGMSIFFHDLAGYYKARVTNSPPDLQPIEYQYADFAYTQRQLMQGRHLAELLAYWRTKLDGIGEPLDLPSDRPRPAVQAFEGSRLRFSISVDQVEVLRKFSREKKATLFMTMLAAFKTFLYRYSGQTDIIVGTPVAERNRVEMEDLVGVFVNNLILRTDLSGNPDFTSLLGRVSDTCLEALEHQALPFERLVEELKPQRDRSRNPLFQVMFAYLNTPTVQLEMEGLSIVPTEEHCGASEYDLSLYIRDTGDSQALECWFEFSTALFEETTIQRMRAHFLSLLSALVEHPDTAINHAKMLSDGERNWLAKEMNDTTVSTPDRCLHELITAQAQAHTDDVAVITDNGTLSYGELDRQANQLAHYLIGQGAGPGVKIGVMLDRDANMLVGLLGILKSGGAYVPLDPNYPSLRIKFMIENSAMPVLLTMHHLLDNLPQTSTQIICFDLDSYEIEQMPKSDPAQIVSTDQLAYVIYTSGSTGQPKGVQVTHANVVNFINSVSARPGFSADDVLLAVTTISFDIHVLELFLPLYCGGKVVVASQAVTQDGALLLQRISEGDITVMQATPATWQMLILAGWGQRLPLKVLCGGDKLSSELAAAILPRAQSLWNMYGPTETTVWSAIAEITDTNASITIGQPVNNTQLYITDPSMQLVPVGVPGELLIGGQGVTQGYLKRPELTQEVFIEHPLDQFSEQRVYRTGDIAQYLPDGRIKLRGRLDHQVKMRGYRIETGEIENVLEAHGAVEQAVVVLREDEPGDQRLVAYLLGNEVGAVVLNEWLKRSLPNYMLPSAFVWLKQYPMTPNNKVDRMKLPAPSQNDATQSKDYVEPQSELESLLVKTFQDVLSIKRVGRYDNFFDLGGHSLLSMKVVARFEQATGIRMHPGEMFQQTIGQIAAYHEQTFNDSRKQKDSLKSKLHKKLKSYVK